MCVCLCVCVFVCLSISFASLFLMRLPCESVCCLCFVSLFREFILRLFVVSSLCDVLVHTWCDFVL